MSSHACRLLRRRPHFGNLRASSSHLTLASFRSTLPLYCSRSLQPLFRTLQTSATRRIEDAPPAEQNTVKTTVDKAAALLKSSRDPETGIYVGPLTQTFRRLKIFSLSSLGLTAVMTPFLFILETASSVPLVGRVALAGTLLLTSTVSTTMVGWLGLPYVTKLVWLPAEKPDASSGGKQAVGVEMTTTTLMLKERITRVYDSAFLVPTNRPLAKWELAEVFKLQQKELEAAKKEGGLPTEETIAETTDKDGNVLGRWIVKWSEDGTGTCRHTGKMIRYFNVHEELLGKNGRDRGHTSQ
ncbi:hypothetical protein BDY19DRAFT_936887 [Irpex rosettiformis]|uniref:Uncharacterized protein n=1 Tax=Irpex rosettiformis TaxID=378272 RepID=A0ACB8U8I2_9APHY|nr:hypothetical protein BDY19DRAFT_936887 [Irpex rosettiformis]